MRVAVKERADRKMKANCKPEPLRKLDCERDNCMFCRSGNPGRCEQNSACDLLSIDAKHRQNIVYNVSKQMDLFLYTKIINPFSAIYLRKAFSSTNHKIQNLKYLVKYLSGTKGPKWVKSA